MTKEMLNIISVIDKYDKWSRYEPEEKGVLIAYASMYGKEDIGGLFGFLGGG